jgi:LacI family transcriptional regulator
VPWLDRLVGIDAVFASNSNVSIAFLALQAASQLGLRIPQDMGVAYFDGYGPQVPVGFSLTNANQKMEEIARRAVEVCLARIRNKSGQPMQVRIPVDIHLGNTTKSCLSP